MLPYCRIDGRTSLKARQGAVDTMSEDPYTRIMLLSLAAGGVGLNLVAANHVVLVDPAFNPTSEDQAADRVYRVGQRKPVRIYALYCTQTIEEHVRRVQVRSMEWRRRCASWGREREAKWNTIKCRQRGLNGNTPQKSWTTRWP